jgi:hypothetical protein
MGSATLPRLAFGQAFARQQKQLRGARTRYFKLHVKHKH